MSAAQTALEELSAPFNRIVSLDQCFGLFINPLNLSLVFHSSTISRSQKIFNSFKISLHTPPVLAEFSWAGFNLLIPGFYLMEFYSF